MWQQTGQCHARKRSRWSVGPHVRPGICASMCRIVQVCRLGHYALGPSETRLVLDDIISRINGLRMVRAPEAGEGTAR
jgi:hypothetical protein